MRACQAMPSTLHGPEGRYNSTGSESQRDPFGSSPPLPPNGNVHSGLTITAVGVWITHSSRTAFRHHFSVA